MVGINYTIDVRRKPCPLPIVMIKNKIADMKVGEVLEVLTSEFVVKENIERFCKKNHHEILQKDEDCGLFRIYIKK